MTTEAPTLVADVFTCTRYCEGDSPPVSEIVAVGTTKLVRAMFVAAGVPASVGGSGSVVNDVRADSADQPTELAAATSAQYVVARDSPLNVCLVRVSVTPSAAITVVDVDVG